MLQIDDAFLADIGLGHLSEEEKQKRIELIQAELEERIGESVMADLSEEQLAEFVAMLDQDEAKIQQWLHETVPGYEQQDGYKAFLREAGVTEDQPVPAGLLANYAVVEWLKVNCPDYQAIVEETTAELKEELLHNLNVITGKA